MWQENVLVSTSPLRRFRLAIQIPGISDEVVKKVTAEGCVREAYRKCYVIDETSLASGKL